MTEHLIRLRLGWETVAALCGPPARPTALPLAEFPPHPGGRLGLSRWFRTPPLESAVESLWLRLDSVPGLAAVSLNGREIARGPFPATPVLLPIGPDLPARNRLVLDVSTASAAVPPPARPWGDVALVVRRSDPD